MATTLAVLAILVVGAVGTALGLLRRTRHLKAELDEVYEAQAILEQARARKNRSHLKLLGLIPLGWLVGSKARLAVASATSATVIGVGFTATDMPPPPATPSTPPAAAGTVPATEPDDESLSYSYSPTKPSTSSSVAAAPPAPATAANPGSAPPPQASPLVAPTPDPPTTTTMLLPLELPTTTTLLPMELPCLNPQGVPLPTEACGSG